MIRPTVPPISPSADRDVEKDIEFLRPIKAELQVPVLSDVHDVTQLGPASRVLDMMQIPAFLCRQTDLSTERPKPDARQCQKRTVYGAGRHEKCH